MHEVEVPLGQRHELGPLGFESVKILAHSGPCSLRCLKRLPMHALLHLLLIRVYPTFIPRRIDDVKISVRLPILVWAWS